MIRLAEPAPSARTESVTRRSQAAHGDVAIPDQLNHRVTAPGPKYQTASRRLKVAARPQIATTTPLHAGPHPTDSVFFGFFRRGGNVVFQPICDQFAPFLLKRVFAPLQPSLTCCISGTRSDPNGN